MYAAGLVKLGDLESKRGRMAEAISFYTKAVSLGDRPEVASALVYLGRRAYGKRDYTQALDLLQRAINVDRSGPEAGPAMTWMAAVRDAQSGAPGTIETTTVEFRSDTVYNTQAQKYDPLTGSEAETLLKQALATEAPESIDAAVTLELYARFLRQHGRKDEADAAANRAATIRRKHIAMDPTLNGGRLPAFSNSADVYRVGAGVTPPIVLSKRDPAYTEEARTAKYQGTVVLRVDVGPDGLAHNIQVVRSLGLGLDEKAIEAVSQWVFKPGTKDGQPVTVSANIEVNFKLL